MRSALCGLVTMMALGCADAHTAPGGPPIQASPPSNPDTVVAEIGGRKVTLKELDDEWQAQDPGERARVTQLVYQNRRTVLDQLVADVLIEEAAKAAGMTVAQFLKQETTARMKDVTDEDVQTFFDSNKERTQGRSLEHLRKPIRDFLMGQRMERAKADIVDELKKKTPTHILLEPPRQAVEITADDPFLGPSTAPVTLVEFSDYQ